MTIQGANNAWSNSGTLRACDPTKIVKLQARFPQATTYTVAFNVDGVRTWGPRAVVQFRTGGNTVQRIVDVTDGTAISGVCEAVNVTCFDSLDPAFIQALTLAGTPRDYTISILVAQGARATTERPNTTGKYADPASVPPTTDIPYVVVPPSSGVLVDIPIDSGANSVMVMAAGAVGVIPRPILPTDAAVVQIIGPPINLPVGGYYVQNPTWVPIVKGANQLYFYNSSLVYNVVFTPVYGVQG